MPPQPASLSLFTQPPGAQVLIDGERRGVTPLTLRVPPGSYALTLRNDYAERSMALSASAGADIVREIELGAPAAERVAVAVIGESEAADPSRTFTAEQPVVAPNAAGWLSVRAPFDVELLEDGEVVGTSALSRIMLPAGRRELQIVSRALEFDERRRIVIAPGRLASVTISAPQVAVNINARPWADVSIDGVAIGQTPIANRMLPIGTRQVVFRHPELGERRQDAVITTRPGQRISLDFTK